MAPPSVSFLLDLDDASCTLSRNGGQRKKDKFTGRGGSGAVGAHPLSSLAYLANALNARGEQLRAGDVVITGAAALCRGVQMGDEFVGRFEGIKGSARVRFAPVEEAARGVAVASSRM